MKADSVHAQLGGAIEHAFSEKSDHLINRGRTSGCPR